MRDGNIHQTARDITSRSPDGFIGDALEGTGVLTRSGVNATGQAPKVVSTSIATGTASAEYAATADGYEFIYENDATTDTSEIAEAFAEAWNADIVARSAFEASATAANLTFTAPLGLDPSLSTADAKFGAVASTGPSEARAIPFGRMLLAADLSRAEQGVRAPLASEIEGGEWTATFTWSASEAYALRIDYDGKHIEVILESEASAQDADDIAAIFEGSLEARAALAGMDDLTISASANVLTIEGAAGKPLTVSRVADTPGNIALAEAQAADDLGKLWLGISQRRIDVHSTTYGKAASEYQPLEGVVYQIQGQIRVEATSSDLAFTDDVWVEIADGDDAGKFYNASSATRRKVPWLRFAARPRDGVAVLEIIPHR